MDKSNKYSNFNDQFIINDDNFSMEYYFGNTSQLPSILDKYSTILKDIFMNDSLDLKKPLEMKFLKENVEEFSNALSKELNMEKVYIEIVNDSDPGAASVVMDMYFDNIETIKNDKGEDISVISVDKYIEIENIIQTPVGYKFKNKKNKFGLISLNVGLFKILEVREISGVICHEIGHMFQQGVFGSYKHYSDLIVYDQVQAMQEKFGKDMDFNGPLEAVFNNTFSGKIIKSIINYLMYPTFLEEGIFTKIGLFFKKHTGGLIDDKTFLMKDKERRDKTNPEDTMQKMVMNTAFISDGKIDRKKDFSDDVNEKFKELEKYNNKIKTKKDKNFLERTRFSLLKFFYSLGLFLNAMQKNVLDLITFNSYSIKTYEKTVFYKKYEFFADIFASSYGYSANLYKSLIRAQEDEDKILNKIYQGHILELPILKTFMLYGVYSYERRQQGIDEHGTNRERLISMYTALNNEITNNTELTATQQKEIKNSIAELKIADEAYYADIKAGGFWYKLYGNLIDHKLKYKNNKDVEDKILEPLSKVLKEKK